jgi:hypothetical protein
MPQFIGVSNIVLTDGGAPGALTPVSFTVAGDLLLWFHYSNADTGNETVTPPTGFTPIINQISTGFGLMALAWRIRQAGDTTYTATVTNHTTGTGGDTIIEWVETYTDVDLTTPVNDVSAALSTWASALPLGPVSASGINPVPVNGVVVVYAGRRENITGQTLLTGDGLSWWGASPDPSFYQVLGNTNLGRDAGAVRQYGVNNTQSPVTLTDKSITTTGTAQAGAGFVVVLNPPPARVVGGIWAESNNFVGPVKDGNGNLYTMTENCEGSPDLMIRKSHDGGDTWLAVDSKGFPSTEDAESLWFQQVGTTVYVLHQRSGTMVVNMHSFNTSDAASNPDTWQLKDNQVHLPTTAPANQAVSLVVRANGDAYAFYRTDPVSGFQRLGYRKKPSGGVWGAESQVDTTASKSFTQVMAVKGAAEVIHVFYKNDTDSKILWRTLDGDTLSGATILNPSSTTSDDETAASPPVYLDVGGTERVFCAWKRLSDSFLIGVAVDGGTPGGEETVSHVAVYEDPPLMASLQTVATLVADPATGKIHALYADDATHDLWHRVRNGTWGTQTEILDNRDMQVMNATIFTHSAGNGGGKVIGVVYDDAQGLNRGVPRYTEIAVTDTPPPAVSDTPRPPTRSRFMQHLAS